MINKSIPGFLFFLFIFGESFAQQLPFTYTYTGKPRFQIHTKRNNNTLGIINVELFPNIAPRHVRNFDSLVSKAFYDSTAFHRVIAGFMIQGGDPNSRSGPKPTWGYGQPSQPKVKAEFSKARHIRGVLSAARSTDINSATSQFFICHAAALHLDGNYSVYGRVTSGINFVDSIATAPKDGNNCPLAKIEMFVTYIGSNDTIPEPPVLTFPKNDSTEVDTLLPIGLKWLPRSDGIIYHVQVSTDSTFATTTFTANAGNLYHYITSGLTGGTKYYWRVNNNNGGHTSAYSPVRYFKTQAPFSDVGLAERNSSGSEPSVFPNPASGKFFFRNIDKGSYLEIFDAQGRLTAATKAVENTLTVDLEGKARGIYSYKITGPHQGVKTGKLLLK